MKYTALLILAGIAFCVSSCLFTKGDKDKIVKVSSEFSIKMFEELGESRNFQLRISSVENHPCSNYEIDISTILTAQSLTLSIKDIVQPSFCLDGMGPATAQANLWTVPVSTVKVNIVLKNTISNEGELKITDDAFHLNMKTKDGLEITFPVLKRIPVRSIWGYIGYDDKAAVGNLPDLFLSDMAKVTQSLGLTAGYYGYFTIDSSSKLVYSPAPAFQFHQSFRYYYEGSTKDLQTLLENYRKAPGGDKLKIKLFIWDGTVL